MKSAPNTPAPKQLLACVMNVEAIDSSGIYTCLPQKMVHISGL
jgi:hypothetical protein